MKNHLSIAGVVALASIVGALGTGPVDAATGTQIDRNAATGTQIDRNAPAVNTPAPPAGAMSARDVPDAKNTLSSAKIIDLTGASVGSVDTVNLDPMGKPISFKVDVGGFLGIGAKDVALNASALKWDPAKKVLITSMTKDQLKALPEVKG